MPEFQLVRCTIALGGDMGNTVVRNRFEPLTFPELLMAQFLHGEEAVFDIHVVGVCEATNAEMLDRLRVLYREEYIQAVFPGNRPRLPMGDQSLPICTQPIRRAPPTRPDNPDPKLKPLNIRELVDRQVVVADVDQALVDQDEPTADEIAAHTDPDGDPGVDLVALGLNPVDQSGMPRVQDQPVTRTNQRSVGEGVPGQKARRQADHLPDVASRPRAMRETDRTRARG